MMESNDSSQYFDAHYYAHGCGEPYQRSEPWLALFKSISERIIRDIGPSSVLDAGCAMGFLVEMLRQRDVEAWGIDISAYSISQVHPGIQPYCRVGSITESFDRRYDLIVCIEVLEHMQAAEAEQAVANFCTHTDDILFSSTPFDYKEATHFNVQAPEYWAELFSHQGFYRDVDFDATFITPWAVRFRRKNEPPTRILREYERKFWPLWKENSDLRSLNLEMRGQLAHDAEQIQRLTGELQFAVSENRRLEAEKSEKERQLQDLQTRYNLVVNSRGWRMLERIRQFVGRGSQSAEEQDAGN